MKHWKFFLLYMAVGVGVAFILYCIFMLFSNRSLQMDIMLLGFLPNVLFCIVLGALDWLLVNALFRSGVFRSNVLRVTVDLALTTLLIMVLVVATNCLFPLKQFTQYPFLWAVLRCSLPIVPWNWIVVMQIELYLYQAQQAEAAQRIARAERDKALYQFEVLKNQINSHFLFNSLNVLSSLVYLDAEKANRFVKKLSSVYRYLLATQAQPTVALREELAFVDAYLYLARIRFGEALQAEVETRPECAGRKVVPAAVQLLVENALKHNVCTEKSPLRIRITVMPDGVTVCNNLQLRPSVTRNGAGLHNLRQQYALHGKNIDVAQTDDEFIVSLPFLDNSCFLFFPFFGIL